jgi:hypothetical protein
MKSKKEVFFGYTVEDGVKILKLKPSSVSRLYKLYNCRKIGNKYFITEDEMSRIQKRPFKIKFFKLSDDEGEACL